MPGPTLRLSLLDLQDSRCIYSGESLNTGSSLDHMIPWSRQRVSTLENLTLTTLRHNSTKGRLLLAPESLERWVHFVDRVEDDLADVASEHFWPVDIRRTKAIATALYRSASPSTRLWDPAAKSSLTETARTRCLQVLA